MAEKKKQQTNDTAETIDNALTRTEQFIEQNQKSLTIIVAAILAIVAIYFGYKRLYLQPKEDEASSQIFQAQYYFEQDSFRLALYGNENDLGFATIADRYGMTHTGNLANYYAGICLREMGEYEKAIDYLKKFDAGDKMITPIAYGAIGDCYVELDNFKDAAKFYVKAANYEKNDFTTPIFLKKAGMVYEELKQYDKALDVYNIIINDFPKSVEARDIEKDIARLNVLMDK